MQTLAIIVNYHSASLSLQAVNSVLTACVLGSLHVVVVDNSVNDRESEKLRRHLPSEVTVVSCSKNIGFGRACNLAFEAFPTDAVLLLNPDGRLLPGALPHLQETLFSKNTIGAVSPRIFWDSERRFQLPPSLPPAFFEFEFVLHDFGPIAMFSRAVDFFWRRYSIRFWKTEETFPVQNLSGGAVLLKSTAINTAGGLFDPRFFLYFEDADLFVRLKRAGFSLLMDPRAEAIHHYDQCGKENLTKKRTFMTRSHQLFIKKYHKPWKSHLKRIVALLKAKRNFKNTMMKTKCMRDDLLKQRPLPRSLQNEWLLELSPDPSFIPAAGFFGAGPWIEFPEECWKLLSPGRYFFRVGRATSFRPRLTPVTTFEKIL
ncbi:glycosyltransferase, group 2 family protein [delta proteobacterium NaphS2]|nr:glycosyltransferase, group 2 family protein [delta proteobacterium NaphS2]